jgi:hypothetical protein
VVLRRCRRRVPLPAFLGHPTRIKTKGKSSGLVAVYFAGVARKLLRSASDSRKPGRLDERVMFRERAVDEVRHRAAPLSRRDPDVHIDVRDRTAPAQLQVR